MNKNPEQTQGADGEGHSEIDGDGADDRSSAPEVTASGEGADEAQGAAEATHEGTAVEVVAEEDEHDVLFLEPDEEDEDEIFMADDDSADEVLVLDTEDAEGNVDEAEHDALKKEHEAALGELSATKDRLLRTAADYENFRRRTAKEKQDLERFGSEKVLRDFLPVIDNLERALGHVAEGEGDTSGLREGVEMVVKQFQQALEKQGVTGFDSAGEMFDPELHEAIQQVDSEEHPTGTIVTEFQRGYHIHDRLLRPALVVVARNTSDSEG